MKRNALYLIVFIGLSIVLTGCAGSQSNTLSNLEVPLSADLEPAFKTNEFEYTLNVPNDIGSVEIIPEATNTSATVEINGIDITKEKSEDDTSREGAATVNLEEGENNVEISVKDSENEEGNIYKINIIREDLSDVRDKFLDLSYTSKTTGVTMPYRLYIPEGYDEQADTKYPIVLFLHGGGERGTDNEKQLTGNMGGTVWATDEVQDKEKMFVLAPQARDGGDDTGFGLTRVNGEVNLANVHTLGEDAIVAKEILDNVINEYNIDENRVYGTGLSQGGFGIWNLALEYPDLFAAIVPVASGANANNPNVEKIVNLPIWAFHAAADPTIPVTEDQEIVNKLESLDANIKYTEYPEDAYFFPSAHFSWVPTYHNEEMIDWMLSQSK